MPRIAGRWLFAGGRRASRTAMTAAACAMLMLLVACNNNGAPGSAADPATQGPGAPSGASTAKGASDPVGSLANPAGGGPIDVSTWLLSPPFSAAGDEPFWRMEIVDGWFSFRRSGLRAIEEPLVQPKREGGADVFDTGSLHIVIAREACETDGGGKGDFTAKVTFDSLDFDGCAFGGQGADAPASAEAGLVADGLATIDTCLAKLGQPALATAIYPRQDGEQTAVALQAKTGALYECVIDKADGSVLSLDPLDQGAQPAWMRRMRFLREGTQTSAACPDAEEVRVGDKVVGRLLGKACKF